MTTIRYSVVGATLEEVQGVGGENVKQAFATGIIFAELTESQASQLRGTGSDVEKVEVVCPTVGTPTQVKSVPTYSPEQIAEILGIGNLQQAVYPPMFGQGQNIAVLDTGIRETHEGLEGKVIYSENFTRDKMEDGFDHGTGVASIIVTTVPMSGLLNMKVLDSKGGGSSENVVNAIEVCIALHYTRPDIAPWVINISVGSLDTGNPRDILRVASRAALAKGILVVAAAGNEGPELGTVMSPACDESVIAVGSASFSPFEISPFSSRGPTKEGVIKPDIVMFGEDIAAASSQGDDVYLAKSGTSFAAPFISGMCLLYYSGLSRYGKNGFRSLQNGESGAEHFQEMLAQQFPEFCVKPQGMPAGKDTAYGYGVALGHDMVLSLGVADKSEQTVSPISGVMSMGIMGMMMNMMGLSLAGK